MLGTYLTNSATAPLMKEYVEIADPLCTYVYFAEDTRAGRVEMPVYVGGVPVAELDGFDERLVKSLKKIVVDGLDMERMKMIIDRDERQVSHTFYVYLYTILNWTKSSVPKQARVCQRRYLLWYRHLRFPLRP